MLAVNVKQKYSEAVAVCNIVTARMRCISREINTLPKVEDPLSPAMRKRVKVALDNHIARCETDDISLIAQPADGCV